MTDINKLRGTVGRIRKSDTQGVALQVLLPGREGVLVKPRNLIFCEPQDNDDVMSASSRSMVASQIGSPSLSGTHIGSAASVCYVIVVLTILSFDGEKIINSQQFADASDNSSIPSQYPTPVPVRASRNEILEKYKRDGAKLTKKRDQYVARCQLIPPNGDPTKLGQSTWPEWKVEFILAPSI